MSIKIAVRNVEIHTPENAPFDPKSVCEAIHNAVQPITGLPVMVTIDPEPRLVKGDLRDAEVHVEPQQGRSEPVALPARFAAIRTLAERACGTSKDSPQCRALMSEITPTMMLDLTAGPAEVERLRADYEHAFNSGEAARGECDALRAQLDELWQAARLLMQVTPRNKSSWADKHEASAIIARLSASAEPTPFPGYPPVPDDRKLPAEPSAPAPECFCVEHGLHIEKLRAQLAEAHALLRDIELTMDAQEDAVSLGYDIELRMAAILRPTTSAEPSDSRSLPRAHDSMMFQRGPSEGGAL